LLEAVVQQYSAAAVLGALLDDLEAAEGLVDAADVVLVTNAAEVPAHLAGRARRLVRVGWALEPGGLSGWPPRAKDRPRAGELAAAGDGLYDYEGVAAPAPR
jgi:hypothetical protein